ncbi:MAG: THUMP-like domain-containing protein, partial [Flammeovirgaceae bacterium]
KELKSEPSVLQTYLYEPNAAILKTGAFKSVALQFNVGKIHQHTHLYSSENLEINFPGRIFKIETVNPTPSDFNKMLPEGKVNVITRNYPLAADKLKKKLKLKDGGNKYVIGFSEEKRKTIVIASRVK